MQEPEIILTVRDCRRRFGDVQALDGLSFDVERGEIFALLGPNGAGKTTMVRVLLGIHRPDSGTVTWRLGGQELAPAAGELGYLPEERGLYAEARVGRTLEYFGRLRGLSRSAARAQTMRWLERFELADRAGDEVKTLSKGNQQKVQFAAAVLHAPRLAILDEPFSGLDPLNQELLCDLVRELQTQGTTIVLSAHQMQLVERLADRVLLVAEGREVLSGTVEAVKRRAAESGRLRLTLAEGAVLSDPPEGLGVERREQDGREVVLHLSRASRRADVLRWIVSSCDVESVRSEEVTLHDVYVQGVRRARGEASA